MGLRFQRRLTLAKGVSLNFSKSGVGISAGPRGAKIGFGPRGAHYSLGIPGTGLAYRKQISNTTRARRRSPDSATPTAVDVKIVLDASGKLSFFYADDAPLPPQLVKQLKSNEATAIRRFLEEQCQRLNGGIDNILNVHPRRPPHWNESATTRLLSTSASRRAPPPKLPTCLSACCLVAEPASSTPTAKSKPPGVAR